MLVFNFNIGLYFSPLDTLKLQVNPTIAKIQFIFSLFQFIYYFPTKYNAHHSLNLSEELEERFSLFNRNL